MRDNDSYKMLYNQLWLLKNSGQKEMALVEDERQLKTRQATELQPSKSTQSQYSKSVELDSSKVVDAKSIRIVAPMASYKDQVKQVTNIPNNKRIDNWDILVDLVNNCTSCNLCYGRKNVVIERGNRNAKWMFVGEGPGENEDLVGKPFVGNAGQLLDKMLLAMKLDKEQDVYICNVVKCRPPNNRNPEIEEINACANYLLSQISLVRPKIIVALGRIAAQMLLQTTLATGKLRNQVHYLESTPLVVTYHPAYLLRNPSAKKDTWQDLQLAMTTYAKI